MSNSFFGKSHFNEIAINNVNSDAFDQFFAIYEEALPAGERKSREVIKKLVERPDYKIIGLADANEIVAFAIVFTSMNHEVGLLEYMATQKTYRNAGLGAQLFRLALACMSNRIMLVEVDSEREAAPDREIRIRRKNFYLRLGCIQIPGLDYLMPAVSDERPPVMDLLYYPQFHSFPLTSLLVKNWLTTIYAEVYGRDAQDPDIVKMLTTLKL